MPRRDADEDEDLEADDLDDDDGSEVKDKVNAEDKQMGMIAHLSGLIAGILGPLIIMIMYKEKSKFVERNAKEALNFDLTMVMITIFTCGLGVIVAAPMSLIFHIIAGLAANKGDVYKYPMTIRLIK